MTDEPDSERHRIQLRGKDGELPAVVVLTERDDDCRLKLEFSGGQYEATASDFFDALVSVRRELWSRELVPVCYGASRNVYPLPWRAAWARRSKPIECSWVHRLS